MGTKILVLHSRRFDLIFPPKELDALKSDRDDQAVQEALNKLRAASQGTDNLMPLLIDAVDCYVTIGEISAVLAQEFGEYANQYL